MSEPSVPPLDPGLVVAIESLGDFLHLFEDDPVFLSVSFIATAIRNIRHIATNLC